MGESVVNKNAKGHGYKYTDLAEVNEYLASQDIRYYQYIEVIDGNDYIYTVPVVGGKELSPRRGCRVVEATLNGAGANNPAQLQGSALTYARRYSLLMAFGLACDDDDAASLNSSQEKPRVAESSRGELASDAQLKYINNLCTKANITYEHLLESNGVTGRPTKEQASGWIEGFQKKGIK